MSKVFVRDAGLGGELGKLIVVWRKSFGKGCKAF